MGERADVPPGERPRFSVLVALVSTCARERVGELVESLLHQEGGYSPEVVLVDRRRDEHTSRLRAQHPELVWLDAAPAEPIPAMLVRALERARGELVAVTEDHCVPAPDWLTALERAFRRGGARVAAVGGVVENAEAGRALDWASFLCEYAAFHPPLEEGPVPGLSGVNVCFRSEALAGLDRTPLASEFWETSLQPALRAAGGELRLDPAVRVRHAKAFPLRLFVAQRFLYSRYWSGTVAPVASPARRVLRLLATPLLVPLFLWRQARPCWGRPPLRGPWLRALPFLVGFDLVQAAGEAVGLLRGPGDALGRIE